MCPAPKCSETPLARRDSDQEFDLRANLGLQGSCNKVPESGYKEFTTRGSEVVPEVRFASCAKNEGGGREVTERRPPSEGKGRAPRKGKQSKFLFCKNLPLIVAEMTFFRIKILNFIFIMLRNYMFGSILGNLFF